MHVPGSAYVALSRVVEAEQAADRADAARTRGSTELGWR
jgi:hypothetical protein